MYIMITIIALLIISVLLYSLKNIKRNKSSAQRQGVAYIIQIKDVISLIQQHRGLNSTWLNGEKQVETKLIVVKKEISEIMNRLNLDQLSHNERWVGFCDHWQRLLQLNNKITVKNSFEQHTQMIKNLAYLLEDTAEEYYLTADYLALMPKVGYVWRELLLVTENIGQSRALGIGVVVQKKCSSVDKIRLNFLIQNITLTSNIVFQKLSSLPMEDQIHNRLVDAAKKQMAVLIKTIDSELVNSTQITLDHTHYFNLATETMDKLNSLFDHQVKQVCNVIS